MLWLTCPALELLKQDECQISLSSEAYGIKAVSVRTFDGQIVASPAISCSKSNQSCWDQVECFESRQRLQDLGTISAICFAWKSARISMHQVTHVTWCLFGAIWWRVQEKYPWMTNTPGKHNISSITFWRGVPIRSALVISGGKPSEGVKEGSGWLRSVLGLWEYECEFMHCDCVCIVVCFYPIVHLFFLDSSKQVA